MVGSVALVTCYGKSKSWTFSWSNNTMNTSEQRTSQWSPEDTHGLWRVRELDAGDMVPSLAQLQRTPPGGFPTVDAPLRGVRSVLPCTRLDVQSMVLMGNMLKH